MTRSSRSSPTTRCRTEARASRGIDRTDAAERESGSGDARARAAPTPGEGRDRVLALQHSAGNRAVGRWLARTRHDGAPRHARGLAWPGEPDVAWTASYDVEFTDGECIVTVFAAFNRDADVTEAQETTMRRSARGAIERLWDNRFELEDRDSGEVFPLRFKFIKVERRPHYHAINVHSGNGTDNVENWFIGSSPTDHAHEFGHQIAMYDEYVDATVANRATAASPESSPTTRSWATTRTRASGGRGPGGATETAWRVTSAAGPAGGCARATAPSRPPRPRRRGPLTRSGLTTTERGDRFAHAPGQLAGVSARARRAGARS